VSSTNQQIDGPRGCQEHELAPTVDLLNLVMRRAVGLPPTIGSDYPHVYCAGNRENMRIIKMGGRVVSHAALFLTENKVGSRSLRVAGLGCMVTHPDYRHRGLGSAVVEDFVRRMTELEADVGWLGTDIPDWYRRLGWEKAGREHIYKLDRGNADLLPTVEGYEVRQDYQSYLEQMLTLHQEHPFGTNRSLGLFKLLLDRPDTDRWPQLKTYLATRQEQLGAYVVVSGKEVVEHAGRPEVVAGLVREVFRREDETVVSTSERDDTGAPVLDASLLVHTPAADDGLSGVLAGIGIPRSESYVGLLRIPDLARLLNKLGLDEIEVRRHEDGVVLTRGGESCTLSPRQQVKLVFGPERVTDFAADLFPVPFYHWPLDYI